MKITLGSGNRFALFVMVSLVFPFGLARAVAAPLPDPGSQPEFLFEPLPETPVLNVRGFSSCLAAAVSDFPLSLAELREQHGLGIADGLLPFLAVYPGVRPSKTAAWVQDAAHWKWQTRFEAAEALLAEFLAAGEGALSPGDFYTRALEVCTQWSGFGRADLLCASVLGHNLFRTLGRHDRAVYYDRGLRREVDLNPGWFRADRERWLGEIEGIRARLLPLRADGGEKFGEWYHFFGILAFSLRELAVHGNLEAVEDAVWWNRTLNPILAGGFEEPEKARLDVDSVRVAERFAWLALRGFGPDLARRPGVRELCRSSRSYRVEPFEGVLSLSTR